jgi:hypothetical protein
MRNPWPAAVLFVFALLLSAGSSGTSAQGQRGGQGRADQAAANAPVIGRARVPTSHANVHNGPSTGNELIVVVAKDTILPVIGRRGEWLQVRLSPELRKTGIVMRWYEKEISGWVHDSTVVMLPVESK